MLHKAPTRPARPHLITLPATMTAAAIDRFGPPEELTPHTLPVPPLDPHDVAIALHSAGVGSWDPKVRDGTWAPPEVEFPLVLGVDGAGIVAATGARVRRLHVGDRVWAYEAMNPKGGCYAEFVVVDANHVGRIPHQLDLATAGSAVVVALAAHQGIDHHLHVREDDVVLVFGASGGVGSYAVQIAKHRGAYVIGTATGHDAQRFVRRLGADVVIDARTEDGLARLSDVAPDGIDAVLALAGGEALERCIDHVIEHGRVAHPFGVEPPARHRKELHVIEYSAEPSPRELDRLAQIFDDAHLHVPLADEYPLDHAADAHRRVEQGHVLGRVGLRIRRGH